MAKRENWFKHDIDSRLGLKMMAYLDRFGAYGYGLFWIIIETLYRTEGHRLAKGSKIYQVLARGGGTKQVQAAIEFAIELGLFEATDDHFWSPRVLDELKIKAEKFQEFSAKRAAAGQLGGLAKASKALAKGSKASERRGEERRLDINTPLPPKGGFDDPKANEALIEWREYRKQMGKKLTQKSEEQIIKKYSAKPLEFVAIVEQSIESGWQGLFPLKNGAAPRKAQNVINEERSLATMNKMLGELK